VLDETMGFSMHVSSREQVVQGNFPEVVARFESGQVPEAQLRAGWDFVPAAWEDHVSRTLLDDVPLSGSRDPR
jgi:hypothetical protein